MWKDKYKVGIDLIDQQHQELFNRVSEFIRTVENEDSWEKKLNKVKETMDFMQKYVVIHFDQEEAYQRKIDYPDTQKHKQIHEEFKGVVNNYVKLFEEEGFTEEKIQEFSAKLMTWLIMHVAQTDQKIGDYVKNKGGEIL
ncbi:bacteriohemerythrin [Clostridiisalibacter paucivorans]|uniref:bacteriohemerythrin n=1 Tax=Clostridiisalibacter paucivorans TaxID=408753 RepID=UPI000687928D|nr:hemerythrin family protein [Clostridiisalibacter paucivorans]